MAVDYAVATHRVTIFGTTLGGAEEWATGFWLGTDGTAAGPPTQAEADAIRTAWNTFFVNGTSKFGNTVKTVGVKVGWIMEDGTADSEFTKYAYYATAITGTGTDTIPMPPQISLCATLTSAKARGFGSKGRMYLPGINTPIDGTGHLNGSILTGITTNLKTFLDSVNSSADVPMNIVLNASGSTGANPHDPSIWPVTGVKIGNVYDTQRRRRNGLFEAYTAAALA